jgi:hypothetical protein
VSDHPARRLWATLETIHDVVYFAPGVREALVAQKVAFASLRSAWTSAIW